MRLLFLDREVLFAWGLHLVSEKTSRRLDAQAERNARATVEMVRAYADSGVKPACTVGSAADVVTHLYKNPALPFKGDCRGFQVRKSLAREAAKALRDKAILLTPTFDHFVEAERLWLAWCTDQAKESYAQFSDYIDSALILRPPEDHVVSDALLGHEHISYILRKERASVRPCILPVQ